VQVRRQWWPAGRRLVSGQTRALHPGLVRPSHTELNITDVTSLRDHLRALHEGKRGSDDPVPIALTLPDLCGRLALFEFDALPEKPAECEALLRWRFQKDFNMATTTARIAYRAFPDMSRVSQTESVSWRVLAGIVKADILEQYEQVCEEAGFIPISVGLASTRILDLYRGSMMRWNRDGDQYFFVNLSESAFSFFVVRAGAPIFLRIKPLRNGTGADASMALAYVANELRASVQFYDDSMRNCEGHASDSAHRVLFVHKSFGWSSSMLVSGSEGASMGEASSDGIDHAAVFEKRLASMLCVKVVPLGWKSLATGPPLRLDADESFVGEANLTALAGIVRA
jgi:hypothetical protein